jgi:hypothetical protein
VEEATATAEQTTLDLDMLLDGLGMHEDLKELARKDPIFREDLIRQLMTIPVASPVAAGNAAAASWLPQDDYQDDDEDVDDYDKFPAHMAQQACECSAHFQATRCRFT